MKECFDFYGLTIEVNSTSVDLVKEVWRDFAYFSVPAGGGQVRVQVFLDSPPYAKLPLISASLITPRNICFQNKQITYIDYFGQGLAVFDRKERHCTVYGIDLDLVREIVYLFILSTVGQYLDSRGLHRVHALGVSYHSRGILLLLPSRGGKSTMALELLRHPGFLLLGEDTPLVDRRGHILPFPLRLGVATEQDTEIPPQYLRTVRRMEFDPKTLIDIEYFHERLSKEVETGVILIGERNLGEISGIVPLSSRRAFNALVKYMIVGLGVYQGMEFLLERGLWELLGKGGVVASRLYNSLRLLTGAPAYRFILGQNTKKNCQTLIEFIRQKYD
jgi:hypothetical protein